MEVIYELKDVSKVYYNSYGDTYALNKINLNIESGKIIVILGPSGSGKSTLLNVLSGIDNPTKGSILFNGKAIDKYNEKELTTYRKDNLGFIFQSYNIIPNLNVKENIELGSHLSEKKLDINEIIKIVELNEHQNKYPYQLSGGQLQRVSIARAVAKNPKVLFCDEPTGALDEKTGIKILKLLQNINTKYNTTIIIVTHNPSIANMAHAVIKMNSGNIVSYVENKVQVSADELRWA